MISAWQALSAVTCADIRLSSLRRNSTVFAMYAISHEVKDRRTEPWWELDFEFLGGRMDAVWINWYQAGKPNHGFYDLSPPPRENTGASASRGTSETRPRELVGGRRDDRAVGDGLGANPSMVFSHWVGTRHNVRWVGGDRIEACVCQLGTSGSPWAA
jgi:hypothetical protein